MGKGSCGRTACTLNPQQLQSNLNINQWENQQRYRPSYNVGPQSFQPVIVMNNGQHKIITMKWGLVPKNVEDPVAFSKDLKTINARSETLTSNPMWKKLLPRNRCVVIADGYERTFTV
jgi:putative SOS response-associated peptidase YedK